MKSVITLALPCDIRFTRLASQMAANTASLLASTCNADTGNWEFSHAFELAISEAFSNAVFYSTEKTASQKVTITFTLEQHRLMATIRDTNEPFSIETPEPSIENYPERGYGLMLIRTVMDTVSYIRENGENIITMSKQL
ncbi:MAG: ATP-binding protein [Chlorobium sp.]|uniref:ATP-binding protein n=1 Tax=Chlorobium sp. TaxID=1095 RepID=UPI0025BA9EFB|nr:ATP-binding protein [Chlorobium sp.]MCF8383065.1 ATP-binding protein [Chlorobium sp.]